MHIYISTPTQEAHSELQLPQTRQPTTSFAASDPATQTGPYVQAAEKDIITTSTVAVEPLEGRTIGCENGEEIEHVQLSQSASMLNKKFDDPTPLIVGSEGETMKLRRFTPLSRLCSSVRLQWRVLFYLIVGLAVLVLLYAAMNRDTVSSTRMDDGNRSGYRISATIEEDKGSVARPTARIKVDVYMESQCPDTADFLESQLTPTWAQLKEYMDLKIIPFGKARWSEKGDDDYIFQCQHGQNECLVNQLMNCGIERLVTPNLYVPYIVCLQGTTFGDQEEAKCDQQARLPHREMQTCADSKHGRQLLERAGNQTKSLNPPLYFVPWVLVDGKRDSAVISDMNMAICKKLFLLGVKPPECERPSETTTPPTAK